MNTQNFCQSCSMPLDNAEMFGTEKDGSQSHEYCKYCYQKGTFTSPNMTLKEMTSIVINEMEKRNIDSKVIDMAVSNLPHLKRWNKQEILHT